MRSRGLLLRVRAALRPAVGRVLAAGLAITLLVPAPAVALEGSGAVHDGAARTPAAAPLPPPPGNTSLISRNRKGGWSDGLSIEPAISDNGRWVAFTSSSTDLVAGDVNGTVDVFLRDRRNGKTIRLPLDGVVPPGGQAYEPAISGDGTVVAFTYRTGPGGPSTVGVVSTTLVLAYDRTTGRTEVVSQTRRGTPIGGAREPSVSETGRYIAYTTLYDYTGEEDKEDDVLRYDRAKGTTLHVSAGFNGPFISGYAREPSISGDGRLVAFTSDGGDSVVNEDTGSGEQVYVRDIPNETTRFVSRGEGNRAPRGQANDPEISGNGRYVAYASTATNLVTSGPDGGPGLFRTDLQTGDTILVSVTPTGGLAKGTSGQPSMTPDGNMIAFASTAPDLAPATALGGIALAAVALRASDVYLRDISAGETILISVTVDGTATRDDGIRSFQPSVAGNGRYVAFASHSPRIVEGDPNKAYDVFLRDLPPVPVINPPTLDLGAGAVGTESAPGAATLANAGWSPLQVVKASITGAAKADFRIVADACAGRRLTRSEACTVSVLFAPTTKGARTATLAISDTFTGSPRTVRLRGRASQAKLVLDPPIGPPGIVTIANGSGFPPGAVVRLEWSEGITPKLADVTADAKGRFSIPVLVFHNDVTGPRDLLAASATGAGFPPTSAEMLVVKPSTVPPPFGGIRIIDLPLFLVIRG